MVFFALLLEVAALVVVDFFADVLFFEAVVFLAEVDFSVVDFFVVGFLAAAFLVVVFAVAFLAAAILTGTEDLTAVVSVVAFFVEVGFGDAFFKFLDFFLRGLITP